MTTPSAPMTALAWARRQVHQLRSAVDAQLVGPQLSGPLLPKGLQHLADAQKIASRLPDRLADPDEHDASVRDMDAHALAAHRYFAAYRDGAAGFGRAPRRRPH